MDLWSHISKWSKIIWSFWLGSKISNCDKMACTSNKDCIFIGKKMGGNSLKMKISKSFPLLIMLYIMLTCWQILHKMHEDKMSTTKVHKYLEKRLYIYIFFFFRFICTCFWLSWVFVAACRRSLVVVSRGYSPLPSTVFSLWGLFLWLLGFRSPGFRSRSTWAQ